LATEQASQLSRNLGVLEAVDNDGLSSVATSPIRVAVPFPDPFVVRIFGVVSGTSEASGCSWNVDRWNVAMAEWGGV